ncbi:MAG: hypothetical protein ACREJC_15460 [Tepidisphaeraceae bacterium]
MASRFRLIIAAILVLAQLAICLGRGTVMCVQDDGECRLEIVCDPAECGPGAPSDQSEHEWGVSKNSCTDVPISPAGFSVPAGAAQIRAVSLDPAMHRCTPTDSLISPAVNFDLLHTAPQDSRIMSAASFHTESIVLLI